MAETERIHAYLPQARRTALCTRQRFPRLIEREEAIAVAYLAVVEADPRWEPSRGVTYHTFMCLRVEGAIVDFIRKADLLSRKERKKVGNGRRTLVPFTVHQDDPPSGIPGIPSEESLLSADPSCLDLLLQRESVRLAALRAREVLALDYPHRGGEVLAMSYLEGMEQKAIGQVFGVQFSRISQIRTAAIRQAREHFAEGARHG